MGYCIRQRNAQFGIRNYNRDSALLEIKALASRVKEGGGRSYSGGKVTEYSFSWVDTESFVKAKTLKEALDAWGFSIEENENGDVTSIEVTGEKLGDEEILLTAIAPFVVAGSFIEIQGEDGEVWRWNFDGKTMEEKKAKISYD